MPIRGNDTTRDLLARVKAAYPPEQFVFMENVALSTGYGPLTRYADALVMGLWPSRGLLLEGFEIKSHRGDWRVELKKPQKADPMVSRCDLWWVVAPVDCVKESELPHGWGLKVPSGAKKLRTVKSAIVNGEREAALARGFVAAMLRRAAAQTNTQAELQEAYGRGYKEAGASHNDAFARVNTAYMELRKQVTTFESSTGLRIDATWQYGHIAEFMRHLNNGALGDVKGRLEDTRALLQSVDRRLSALVEDLVQHEQGKPNEEG